METAKPGSQPARCVLHIPETGDRKRKGIKEDTRRDGLYLSYAYINTMKVRYNTAYHLSITVVKFGTYG